MAMCGDDFTGAGYDVADEKLRLLKGEAKSKKVSDKTTVTSARKAIQGRMSGAMLKSVALHAYVRKLG